MSFWTILGIILVVLMGVVGIWQAHKKHQIENEPGFKDRRTNLHREAVKDYRILTIGAFVGGVLYGVSTIIAQNLKAKGTEADLKSIQGKLTEVVPVNGARCEVMMC